MSNVGQVAFRIVGTVVGAYFGNPALGYTIGSMAGDSLFPTDLGTVTGPRLSDLQVQTATIGVPIPLVYGQYAIAGNIIWSSGIIETKHKEKQGGKGGPTQTVKTFTYSVNIAVGICEGEIKDLLRVWADAVLIYDASDQRTDEADWQYVDRLARNARMLSSLVLIALSQTKDGMPAALMETYKGDEFQLPDPTIESWEGVGNVSAFRGLAYVVFTEFQLADFGNRVPNFRFEVIRYPVENPQWNPARAFFTGNSLFMNKDASVDPATPSMTLNGATDMQFVVYEQDPQNENPLDPYPKKPLLTVMWRGPQWHIGGPEGVGDEMRMYGSEVKTLNDDIVQPYQLFDHDGNSTLDGGYDIVNVYGPIHAGFNSDAKVSFVFDSTGNSMWVEENGNAWRWDMMVGYSLSMAVYKGFVGGAGIPVILTATGYDAGAKFQFSEDGTLFFAGFNAWRCSTPFNLATKHGFGYHIRVHNDGAGSASIEFADVSNSDLHWVLKVIRSSTSQDDSYVEIGTNGSGDYYLADNIPFRPNRLKFRVHMATDAPVGTEVRLRVRNYNSGIEFSVARAYTTHTHPDANDYRYLIFDFANFIKGKAIIPHLVYNKLEISFAHGINGGTFGEHEFNIDEIEFMGGGGWWPLQFNKANVSEADDSKGPLYILNPQRVASRDGYTWPLGSPYLGPAKFNPAGQELHWNHPNGMTWAHLETPWELYTVVFKSQGAYQDPLLHGSGAFVWHPDGFHFWTIGKDNYLREYAIKAGPHDADELTLGEIVFDVCRKCGLREEQIDVSDLTEVVHGYTIGSVMSGRDIISPLRSYGFFDCVESENSLKWPTRGKAAVADYTVDDLGARASGSDRSALVRIARKQEAELPQRLRVHYAQSEKNYEAGEQSSSRTSVATTQTQDVEVAVAMTDSKAAQIAEVLLYESWIARNGYSFSVGNDKLPNEAADPITCPIEGRQERIRITNIDYNLAGILAIEAVRDDDGVYVSYALGTPNVNTGNVGGGAMDIPGTADAVLLDLPVLRDSDDNAGYYVALSAANASRFAGGALYRSPDGGVSYESVATILDEATMGTLTAALPAGPTDIIDEGNDLIVDLSAGDLESISDSQLLAGLNAAAIGADDRWEIIQFRDVAINSPPDGYTLRGLLRGRRGTEWAVGLSQIGDRFVLLDSSIVRVPMNITALGVAKPHRAVLVGQSLEAAPDVSFAGEGVALMPFSVVFVTGARDGSDNLTISWVRRGRIGTELASTGYDVPLSEATEAYEVEIMNGVTVVRTLSVTAQTAVYSAADQVTDFGSPQSSIIVRIYQLSAVVGRGYVTEETV